METYAIQKQAKSGEWFVIIDARECPVGVRRVCATNDLGAALLRTDREGLKEFAGPSTDGLDRPYIPYSGVRLADVLPIPFEDACMHEGEAWVLVQLRHTPPHGKRGWTWDKAVQEDAPDGQRFDVTNGNCGRDFSTAWWSWVCWAKLDEVMTWPRNEEALLAARSRPARCEAKAIFEKLDKAKPYYVDQDTIDAIHGGIALAQYTSMQREGMIALPLRDRERASALWSAQLRAKVAAAEAEAKRKDREQVICDDDRWEP